MKKIGLSIYLIVTCLLFSSTYCGDECNYYYIKFINNCGSDVRLFGFTIPNENYSSTLNDFDENRAFQYKVKDNDTINLRVEDSYVTNLFVIDEKNYIEIYKNTGFDKIKFDKNYLLRYNDTSNNHIVINYTE